MIKWFVIHATVFVSIVNIIIAPKRTFYYKPHFIFSDHVPYFYTIYIIFIQYQNSSAGFGGAFLNPSNAVSGGTEM